MTTPKMNCPVCEGILNSESKELSNGACRYACYNCGTFDVSEFLVEGLSSRLGKRREARAVLSHALRRMQKTGTPFLDEKVFARILEHDLPSVSEQRDNLIVWLGENLPIPGDRVWIESKTHRAVLGAVTKDGFRMILTDLVKRGLVDCNPPMNPDIGNANAALTVDGWSYFEKLRQNRSQSKIAFMAMKYGEEVLDRLFKNTFKPAVAKTGFELRRLDEQPRAGLIDDRLRVEIRNARFLVADLTHDNQGAYWEAGFAEGLGKPVIYTCEKAKFDSRQTHFDTNHHLTIKWAEGSPQQIAEDLKAAIRATLPDEARMTDD